MWTSSREREHDSSDRPIAHRTPPIPSTAVSWSDLPHAIRQTRGRAAVAASDGAAALEHEEDRLAEDQRGPAEEHAELAEREHRLASAVAVVREQHRTECEERTHDRDHAGEDSGPELAVAESERDADHDGEDGEREVAAHGVLVAGGLLCEQPYPSAPRAAHPAIAHVERCRTMRRGPVRSIFRRLSRSCMTKR
jgi:hypothetical protein